MNQQVSWFFLICLSLVFFSCVPQELEEENTDDFEIALKWAHIDGSDEWDQFLKKALEEHGSELMDSVPNDIATFSPNYLQMDYSERLNFWAYLISIMAEKESSFNPTTTYTEAFTDANGDYVISTGLLQLSIESARGYQCPVDSTEDLKDPENNLICAVLIMRRWVLNDGVISGKEGTKWRGGARYWSVLRKESTLSFFREYTLSLF